MNLTEAIAEVVTITKRPEKQVETISAINKAIAFWTLKANWKKDLVETSIPISPILYGDTVDLSLLTVPFIRFRKFKYVKPTGQRYYLTPIEPEQIFTPVGNIQPNRYYVAGDSLTYTLSQVASTLEVGYYQHAPLLTKVALSDTHWMLNKMPWAVTERAAAQILFSIGDDASAKFYQGTSMEFFLAARKDFEDQIAVSAS